MSKVIVAAWGVEVVKGYLAKKSGDDAAEATAEGTAQSIAAQTEALDYLKEVEALPRFYREQAMQMLGTEFGLISPYEAGQQAPQDRQEPQTPGVTTGVGIDSTGQRFGQQRSMADYTDLWGQDVQPGQDAPAADLGPPPPERIPNPDYRPARRGRSASGGSSTIQNPAFAEYQQAVAQAQAQPTTQPGIGQPGGAGAEPQMSIFERAVNHPLYKQLYEGIEDTRIELSTDRMLAKAEESVMRRANVSGGFRSGGMQRQLLETGADIDERLQLHRQTEDARIKQEQNAILVDAYNRQITGLSGFTGAPANTTNIAESIRGIGTTRAEGTIAQGNIEQERNQAIGGAIVGGIENTITARREGLI
ncbi:MAG: hypothetical protein V3V40_06545 [Nitrosomonadaceae bacterium]